MAAPRRASIVLIGGCSDVGVRNVRHRATTKPTKSTMTEGDQMKAVTWHGKRDVRVDDVPDPAIQESNDAIVRITTTAICGSALPLYEVLGPFRGGGDVLGHEPMGIVEEVGP